VAKLPVVEEWSVPALRTPLNDMYPEQEMQNVIKQTKKRI
jgi:hypothetical protein